MCGKKTAIFGMLILTDMITSVIINIHSVLGPIGYDNRISGHTMGFTK